MNTVVELLPFIGGFLFVLLRREPGNLVGASFVVGFFCALCAGELAGSTASALIAIALDSSFAAFAILTTRALGKRRAA
jgi:hypothetical protein